MRYWAHINNEVCGPFEKEKLPGLSGFGPDSFICPQTGEGEQAAAWKPASAFPEVMAVLAPAPAPSQPRPLPAEDSLAMTMRGSIIELTPPKEQATTRPRALPAAVSPQRAAGETAARQDSGQQPEPLTAKLEQMSAMLASIAANQSQALERLGRLEGAVAEMKTLLLPKPPKAG